MRVDLAGRKALVTGASTGICRAIAVALARAGCDVAVGYRASRQEAEEVAGLIRAAGRNTVVLEGDVALEEQAKAVVEGAASALGGLDILVNNAGSLIQRTPLTEADTQVWRRVMGTNLDSVYYCTRYAVPYLRQSAAGRVINMGSVAGHTGGGPGAWHYAAAKGGVHTLTMGFARELAPYGITVNAVAPGVIDTPFHQRFSSEERMKQMLSEVPLGRIGTPEDVAPLVVFLASDQASYITGQVIAVNGGQLMR